MKMFIKVVMVGVICTLFGAGCSNTVQGFGKDMENSGQEIQKSVSR